ncbi:MAG: VCBS repeat-containing protein [Acidobacteriota bacterium]
MESPAPRRPSALAPRRRLLGSLLLVGMLGSSEGWAGLPGEPVLQLNEDYKKVDLIIAQLTDDDGDGAIDRDDHADLVLLEGSDLVGYDVSQASELFRVRLERPLLELAAGDLDGDGRVEIVAADHRGFEVREHDGAPAWTASWPSLEVNMPALGIADLNQDGVPELYRGPNVRSVDDSLVWSDPLAGVGGRAVTTLVADLLPDSPGLELLAGRHCYRADGSRAWTAPVDDHGAASIGDIDGDGDPEIAMIVAGDPGEVVLLDHLGARLGGLEHPDSGEPRPLFFFDVEGDGISELLLTYANEIRLFDWDGATLIPRWSLATNDRSCCGGATSFDFEGDGAPELLYQDEDAWHVVEGRSGRRLFWSAMPSSTWHERPLVANLDADPQAEIVIAPIGWREIDVHEVPCSVTPRGIWNQRQYHVTNVDPDGRIPMIEAPAWTGEHQWNRQATAGSCGPLTGLEGLDHVFTCPGEEVVLDASAVAIAGCSEDLLLEWSAEGVTLGTEPTLHVTVGDDIEIRLTVSCPTLSCCHGRSVMVGPSRPAPVEATAADPLACAGDLEVRWAPVEFRGGVSGWYNVYRSVGPDASCDDALTRPPVATALTTTTWRDDTTLPDQRHVYVVEAEDPGVSCPGPVGPAGGAATRSCVEAVDVVSSAAALPPRAKCQDEPVLLDASTIFTDCSFRQFTWREGDDIIGYLATITVDPERSTTFEVTVACPSQPDCVAVLDVPVEVVDAPVMGATPLADNDRCLPGILVRWNPATFNDPVLGGVYHVHRSDADSPTCEDALARPALVEGLTETRWFDETTLPDREYVYVIVAEDALPAGESPCPTGPTHGGLINQSCLPAFTDGIVEEPAVVWAPLRARNRGEEVTFLWPTARDLLRGESFVLLKAVDRPYAEFAPVPLASPDARSYTEIDTSSPRQFFDLRVENCRAMSVDEYPPGP